MASPHSDAEILREILERVQTPGALDSHPWTARSFVKDAVERIPGLQTERPGRQLIAALAEIFSDTRPSTPPRRGKRLDTRWGEFGILAALYFGPYRFGTPVPNSLRDAWGRIDQSILLYVNGHKENPLPQSEIESYKLVGDEPQVAPISTLSDWHCKGIQRLADAIPARENYLKNPLADKPSLEHSADQTLPASPKRTWASLRKAILIGLTLITLIGLTLGGFKAKRIYDQVMILREDMGHLRQLSSSDLDLKRFAEAGMPLSKSREDFDRLLAEVEPVLWLGPWLDWVPVYGGDLASSREMLQLADLLLESAETTYLGMSPLVSAMSDATSPAPAQMIDLLGRAQPELMRARETLDRALQIRAGLDLERLSPRTRSLIQENVDRLMPLMEDGLAIGTALPAVMGAAEDGPKTYLLLAQNEDELRPTGGFITAVGTLVVQDGKVLRLGFVDSGELENWDYPYPAAPWQLEQYMNSPVLILRDANWFTDFPTAALYVESLYAYKYSHSVDGVIAFDQHLLVMILEALGPIHVEGEPDLIDAKNVVTYMRSAKSPPADQPLPADWSRKGFMDKITRAMLLKIFQGTDIPWRELGYALFQGLRQHHLLLQVDNPTLAPVIARYNWDGRLGPEEGDFLMVVDSNLGFNKTNAVVDTRLSYDVDLTDLASPLSTLTVTHHNASATAECVHWGAQRLEGQEDYPIDACYWNYMRVYVPFGTELLAATPQRIPKGWMLTERGVPARVDILDEELQGLQAFGTLKVVPGGQSLTTTLQFRLPGQVLLSDGDRLRYRLKIKKQPGTIADPIIIRIHFPNRLMVESVSPNAVIDGDHILIETDLRTDRVVNVDFLQK